jgi:hypothetical protein
MPSNPVPFDEAVKKITRGKLIELYNLHYENLVFSSVLLFGETGDRCKVSAP